ncbi:MAG: hypothetical protein JO064_08375 [Actinobacteria bacterium]|nr:hypothetical protein [Actinomycetota bacterium]
MSAAALLLAGSALAKSGGVIGTGVTLKGAGGKIAYASATAKAPNSVSAKITATPSQKVKIQWSMTCTKGGTTDADAYNSSTTPKSGISSISAPGSLKLGLPFAKPSSCAITVYSTLSKSGKQTLTVIQT